MSNFDSVENPKGGSVSSSNLILTVRSVLNCRLYIAVSSFKKADSMFDSFFLTFLFITTSLPRALNSLMIGLKLLLSDKKLYC